MTSYSELLAQRERLDREIAVAREKEIASAIAQVQNIVADFGLTPAQVFPSPKSWRKAADKATATRAKYRDPNTGATWTGMGREPHWIKGKPRDQFLIEGA